MQAFAAFAQRFSVVARKDFCLLLFLAYGHMGAISIACGCYVSSLGGYFYWNRDATCFSIEVLCF